MPGVLTDRLEAVLKTMETCDTLADIGTDHAYLPIEAVFAEKCKKAIACDINAGPLKTAEKNIREAGLTSKIETRLGDGLKPLKPAEADCITIAGMGGKRIIGILDESMIKFKQAQLVLQPQHDLEDLRRFLHRISFNINEEALAIEDSRFYVIVSARYAENVTLWTDMEYFLGKLSSENLRDLQKYNLHRLEKMSRYIKKISDVNTRLETEKKMKWLENNVK